MCVFHPRLLDAEAGSHSNCDEEAIDVQQLHPVTDTLLSHLSLSAPPPTPQPAHPPHPFWKALASSTVTADRRAFFVATHGVKRALSPSGQAQFDSYPSP